MFYLDICNSEYINSFSRCSLKYFSLFIQRLSISKVINPFYLSPRISQYKSFDSNYRHFIPRRDSFPIIFFFVQTTINLPRFVSRISPTIAHKRNRDMGKSSVSRK